MTMKNTLIRGGAAALALLPLAALAHVGGDGAAHHGFADGLLHPFTGPDHLAAMLAVGAWSALAVRPKWLAPAAFVALLVAGALAGLAGLRVPAVEPMIAASLLVLGLLVAMRRGMPWALAGALTGLFAFFHGAAHGTELQGGHPAQMMLGMVIGTALLHAAGMVLGTAVLQRHRWTAALAGLSTAALGVALLARMA